MRAAFEKQEKENRVRLMADIETYIQYLNDNNIQEFNDDDENVVDKFMSELMSWHTTLNDTCVALRFLRRSEKREVA